MRRFELLMSRPCAWVSQSKGMPILWRDMQDEYLMNVIAKLAKGIESLGFSIDELSSYLIAVRAASDLAAFRPGDKTASEVLRDIMSVLEPVPDHVIAALVYHAEACAELERRASHEVRDRSVS